MGDQPDDTRRKRLRVPAALVVAFVGSAGAVSVWYGGCHDPNEPWVDAGSIEMRSDATLDHDAGGDGGGTVSSDGGAPVGDAPRDAPPDTPPQ